MEKIEIELKEKEPQVIVFGSDLKQIKAVHAMSMEHEIKLTEIYLDSYFEVKENGDLSYDYFSAEYSLMIAVLDLCTNAKVTEDTDEGKSPCVNISNGTLEILFKEVTATIRNYSSFRKRLDRALEDAKELAVYDRSLEKKVNQFILNGMESFLDFSEDLTVEKIEGIRESFGSLLEDVKESPLKKLVEEGFNKKA